MNALRREILSEEQENAILEKLAEEGQASGEAEGDVMAEMRAKYGWNKPGAPFTPQA